MSGFWTLQKMTFVGILSWGFRDIMMFCKFLAVQFWELGNGTIHSNLIICIWADLGFKKIIADEYMHVYYISRCFFEFVVKCNTVNLSFFSCRVLATTIGSRNFRPFGGFSDFCSAKQNTWKPTSSAWYSLGTPPFCGAFELPGTNFVGKKAHFFVGLGVGSLRKWKPTTPSGVKWEGDVWLYFFTEDCITQFYRGMITCHEIRISMNQPV